MLMFGTIRAGPRSVWWADFLRTSAYQTAKPGLPRYYDYGFLSIGDPIDEVLELPLKQTKLGGITNWVCIKTISLIRVGHPGVEAWDLA